MGREKDRLIRREENARDAAKREGMVCACGTPLLTANEREDMICSRCRHNLDKDD